jgi:histone H1/5
LKQSKGTGASGSFRIGEVKAAKKPAKAKKAAKPKE